MDWIRTWLIVAPLSLVLGVFIGYLLTSYLFTKQMKEWQKKMAEPDKEQVRNMLTALGQKPSEEQVNRFINMAKSAEKKKTHKKNPLKNKKQ